MSMCRTWLKAVLSNSSPRVLKAYRGCAVLGDSMGYTVELHDGEQIHVGRQDCKYCARAEALSYLTNKLDSVPAFAPDQLHVIALALHALKPDDKAGRVMWADVTSKLAEVVCSGLEEHTNNRNAQQFFFICEKGDA